MKRAESNNSQDVSFNSWLKDKHNKVEKTAGAAVLIIEMMEILAHRIFPHTPDIALTQGLNLGFLVFIFIQLNKEFSKGYTLDNKDPKLVAKIVRLWRSSEEHRQHEIDELVRSSNKSIGQLRNINYFILSTCALYLLFLVQTWTNNEKDASHYFHLLVDFVSYLGAFFMLRAFFVMFLPTVEGGRDVLNRKTYPYAWLGLILIVIDFCLTKYVHEGQQQTGVFIAEFICGVVNAVIFALLIARFENKILDIPPYILFVLYSYGVLQTCLPFVTNAGQIFGASFSANFSGVVLRLVLIGKVALAAMVLYVLTSGRIVYYFMFTKNLHEEEKEERHWENFKGLLKELPRAPEPFEILYEYHDASNSFSATIVPRNLFGRVIGSGKTQGEAKDDLRKQLQTKSNPF
jgi:hypothetical protein